MEVVDYLPNYPSIKDPNFVQKLSTNYEFWELRDGQDPVSEKYFNVQLFVRRFLSNITPYDRLFLFMEVGTGKTCSAVAAAEGFYLNLAQGDGIGAIEYPPPLVHKKILIILKNSDLEEQFKREIVQICEENKYIDLQDENYLAKDIRDRKSEITAKLRDTYEFKTMGSFANDLAKMNDLQIKKRYSDHIIIFDEAHTIREGDDKKDTEKLFTQYKRFFGLIKPYKTIFNSATPAIDQVSEFMPLFNIFLPLNNQLPTDINIKSDEFNRIFREKIRGRILYVREQLPKVTRLYPGEKLYGTKFTLIRTCVMEGQQRQVYDDYMQAHSDDSFAKKQINISNAIFPDGSYGSDGFSKYIEKKKGHMTGIAEYSLKSQYQSVIRDRLRELSTKYYEALQIISDNPKDKFFMISKSIHESGLIYFSLILQLFKWAPFYGSILPTRPGKRFILLTGDILQPQRTQLLKVFNDPRNKYGEYIQLAIGSEVVMTGVNILHTRAFMALDTFWNDPTYTQAIGRVLRQKAFDIFPESERYLKIFNMAAVLTPDYDSSATIQPVNIRQYQAAERKLIDIKPKERIAKEESVGCVLLKKRNQPEGFDDYSKECDLDRCNYECGDGSALGAISFSSYNLFFAKDEYHHIIDKIKLLFRFQSQITLQQLFIILAHQHHNRDLIYFALDSLLNNQVLLLNRLGQPGYLYLLNDVLIFSTNPHISRPTSGIYSESAAINNTVTIKELYNDAIQDSRIDELKTLLGELSTAIQAGQPLGPYKQKVEALSARQKVVLLESVYGDSHPTAKAVTDFITKVYPKNIGTYKGAPYHDLYRTTQEDTAYRAVKRAYKEDEPIRIYSDGRWRDATLPEANDIIEVQNKATAAEKEKFKDRPFYGFEGNDQVFRIVDNFAAAQKVKKTGFTGQACSSWNKLRLANIVVKYDIPHQPYPPSQLTPDVIRQRTDIISVGLENQIKQYTDAQVLEFWSVYQNNKRDDLCKLVYDYFKSENLML